MDGAQKTPVHLWIVGILALLWNAMGAFDYTATHMQMESYMSNFTEAQREYFYGFPAWAIAFWAVGVWGALLGSIFLLMRKSWAVWAFVASLLGMIGSSVYTLGLTEGMKIMGPEAVYFSIAIWVIAVALLAYSVAMKKRGVLR